MPGSIREVEGDKAIVRIEHTGVRVVRCIVLYVIALYRRFASV
jgi:hypothetical protein